MREKKTDVPQWKKDAVSDIAKSIKKYNIIALTSLTNVPSRQLNIMRKKLRGKAEFIVTKKSILERAFEKAGKGSQLLEKVSGTGLLILTNINPFELAAVFRKGKEKVAAKPGQIAPFDIIVPVGDTDLAPGPALSELKNAGINAMIKAGKIAVQKDSTVAKKGEKIPLAVAKALMTLGIKPLESRMYLDAALENDVLYTRDSLEVDEEKVLADLVKAMQLANNLSINVAYPTSGNVKLLLGKAFNEAKGLAIKAGAYEPEVMDQVLAKALAEAKALAGKVNFNEV